MDVRTIGWVGVSFLFFSCGPAAERSSSERPLSGKAFYEQKCVVCHGLDGKLGASGSKDLTQSILTTEEIRTIIQKGKNGMPAFEQMVSNAETLEETVLFVEELREK